MKIRLPSFSLPLPLQSLLLGLACALVISGIAALHWLDGLRNIASDAQFQMRPARSASRSPIDPRNPKETVTDIVIVAVDEATIARIDQYPIPRGNYAKMVRNLTLAGADTIAFDVFFTAKSPLPTDDKALALACAQSGRVVHSGSFILSSPNASQSYESQENAHTLGPRFRVVDRGAICEDSAWGSVAYPPLRSGAAAIGYVNAPPELDGTLRRIPHLIRYNSQKAAGVYPSMALAAAAHHFGVKPENIVARGHDIFLRTPAGVRRVTLDGEGKSWINWVPGYTRDDSGKTADSWTLNANSFTTISANKVLDLYNPKLRDSDKIDPAIFHNRIVLIAVTTAGAFERHATPFSHVQAAVELQANAIDDILTNRPLYEIPALWQIALLVFFPTLIAFIVLPRSAAQSAAWTLGLCAALWFGGVYLLHINWILPVVPPIAAGLLTAILATGNVAIRDARQLKVAEERYAVAVRGANDGLWDWNLESDEIYFAPRWKTMLGYADEEIGAAPGEWFRRVQVDDLERLKHDLKAHLDGETPHFECQHRMIHASGKTVWMMSRGLRVCGEDGKPVRLAGSLTDITEHKDAQAQLEHNAFFDSLTGLPNRALFMDRLEHALSRARRRPDYRFAVLFMDLDRFKVVNDSLGHVLGDKLLVELSKCFQVCLRPDDTAARLGGDEFTILLEDIADVSDTTRVVERIQEQLLKPMNLDGHEIFPTVSIGIAISTPKYERPEELLRDADAAMYRAKSLGRSRHELFDEAMHARALGQLQLETDMRRAIDRKEFQAYYQPIVSMATGQIAGFEALVRWHHPERGMVSPGEFIPLAEETGLVVPIDQQVLRQACAQTRRWQLQFPDRKLIISVNLSSKQFAQHDLVEQIAGTLREVELDPRSVKLEITEGVIMNDPDAAAAMLLQLKALGIQLSIDDFGTGYSSLAYLHRFPLDTLKIDQSFVARMGAQGENSEIVKTIVALARNMNMETVAEGVETREQHAQLRWLRCTYGQGYLWSRPVPAAEAEALLERDMASKPETNGEPVSSDTPKELISPTVT